MTEQTNLVPKRRFKEFQNTYDWEQRKFADIFDCSIPNNTLSRAELNYDIGEIKSVHYGDILVKYGAITDVAKDEIPFITNGDIAKYKSHLLNNGDIIVADTAEDETVGKATEIAGISDDFVVSGLHTIVCRPKADMQENYLGYYMNSSAYHSQLLTLMQGIKVLAISRSSLAKTTVSYPVSSEEQRKVGMFFKHLDNLITLQQRKLEKTKAIKSAYLSEMFPAEGERVPKRRFAGFTQVWEQHKLGELLELENGYAFKSKYFQDETAKEIVLTPGNVNIGGGFQDGKGHYYDMSGIFPQKFVMKPGDIFVTMTDLTPSAQTLGSPAFIPNDGNVYLHNQRIGKLINYDGNKDFLFYLLCTEQYHKQIVLTASGTTVKHSSPQKILDCLVSIPSIEEQERIGEFLRKLDHLITFHQRKLEKLQNIKKAYLNEMFV